MSIKDTLDNIPVYPKPATDAPPNCAVVPGSAECPECKGDGWIKAEWDECTFCYGTGREQTDEWRANMRVSRAQDTLLHCERVLSGARLAARAASNELTAARAALQNKKDQQ